MPFNREQQEIVDLANNTPRTKGWTKFTGDRTCRIIMAYMSNYLNPNLKIVGPNCYIDTLPIEIDLLIVGSEAVPQPYTSAYKIDDIKASVEVKAQGVRGIEDLDKTLNEFNTIIRLKSSIRSFYITLAERLPKKNSSDDWVAKTRNRLSPYPVFVLSNDNSKHAIFQDEWEKTVTLVKTIV